MDSHSPIAARNAGEPSDSVARFTFAMWNTFKWESDARDEHLSLAPGFRPFQAARAADCGDGRCRGAYHPTASGQGHAA